MQYSALTGSSLLSDLIVYLKYGRYLPHAQRREVWDEICDRGGDMHADRWPHIEDDIREAFQAKKEKKILSSMRAAQFAGAAAVKKPNRLYNCAYLPMLDVKAFSELFYNLLCGCGVGYSVQSRHIQQLPAINGTSTKEYAYIVPDTIEGWCDSLLSLIEAYTYCLHKPIFDFSKIRPEGSPLITSGGRAPGPDPLKLALQRCELILRGARGRKLSSLEVHDICCHVADAVHAGGIRRAAMIAFFDRCDTAMLTCKSDTWWEDHPQRGRSNNSAVFVRGEVTQQDFMDFWEIVVSNQTGEPGIFWTNDPDDLANPCVEISLPEYGFCNLTTVNGSNCVDEADFFHRVRMAARIGTLQAGWTAFPYLRPQWQKSAEKLALLGVSITGITDGNVQQYDLRKAAQIVLDENAYIAGKLDMNLAHRTTTVKPEGTGSLVLESSNGVHTREAEHYFKCLRIGKNEPVYPYLLQNLPDLVEDLESDPRSMAIVRMPVATKGKLTKSQENPLQLLERVKDLHTRWVRPGHREGLNTHNISCTVSIKDGEWAEVGKWMWENRDSYNGLATFPWYGGTHRQLPISPCTETEYNNATRQLRKLDLREVTELENNVKFEAESACAGGMCEL